MNDQFDHQINYEYIFTPPIRLNMSTILPIVIPSLKVIFEVSPSSRAFCIKASKASLNDNAPFHDKYHTLNPLTLRR